MDARHLHRSICPLLSQWWHYRGGRRREGTGGTAHDVADHGASDAGGIRGTTGVLAGEGDCGVAGLEGGWAGRCAEGPAAGEGELALDGGESVCGGYGDGGDEEGSSEGEGEEDLEWEVHDGGYGVLEWEWSEKHGKREVRFCTWVSCG